MDVSDPAKPNARRSIDGVTFSEALDADSRPHFVLGPGHPQAGPTTTSLLFYNQALAADRGLLQAVELIGSPGGAERQSTEYRQFWSWLTHAGRQTSSHQRPRSGVRYAGIYWTSSTVRNQYQVISGNLCEHSLGDVDPSQSGAESTSSESDLLDGRGKRKESPVAPFDDTRDTTHQRIQPSKDQREKLERPNRPFDPNPPPSTEDAKVAIPPRLPTSTSSDWTAPSPRGILSTHEKFARNTDWASTPLGPMSGWSAQFREIVNLLMRNPHPASIFWGQELNMLYNDAYRLEVAGNKHPGLMGSGFFGPFAELWEDLKPIFEECARTGKSIRKENDRLLIERYGYLEETFFSWSWTPLYGGTDRILGFYNAPFETTYQTVGSRRMETLRYLGEQIAHARSVQQFWKGVLVGLETNPYDIPFATLHSIGHFDESDTSSVSSSSTIGHKQCVLEGTIAVPEHHPAAPLKIDLASHDGLAPMFRNAVQAREPTLLRTSDQSLPALFAYEINFRGFGIPSKEALVIPIRSADRQTTVAILLIGLNPRREYDRDYRTFVAMLSRQLETSLASILRLEDEAKSNRTAAEIAALQQERLTQELALQTSRLRRMTELSPLGMFLISPDGMLLEANDRYYEMTNHSKDTTFLMSFMDTVAESCRAQAVHMWEQVSLELNAQTEEIQLSNNYNTQTNEETGALIDCWVLAFVIPEIGEDGKIRSIMGSITDISHMKWARTLQDQRLREAEETKRQQNAFIDITSHEMRNPLSAVLICADDILDTLTRHQFSERDSAVVSSCIEAASTITLCVQHQKSIVDDVLTISKLNSNLLVISPIPTQPTQVIQQAMKMFKNETQAKDIDMSLHLHPSLDELNVNSLALDPGRLLQITINLITNSIKFTQDMPKRSITVHVGISLSPPLPVTKGFDYIPTREPVSDVTLGSDWGRGTLMYLRVKVADTGCGLTQQEKRLLFERFSQASPRTHAQYGGSGLGLFISRQLAELHGGQIGVASESGSGSTFGFFIQCRRAPDTSISNDGTSPGPATQISRLAAYKRKNASDTQLLEPARQLSLSEPGPVPQEVGSDTLHILVVEDNLVNQSILKKQLEKAGFVVNTADNGIQALRYLETTELYSSGTRKISLVLMDLEMPEMDGLTCVERIRQLQASGVIQRRVPVVAVTANVRPEQILVARKSGMDDIVSKPFRISELIRKIEHVVGRAVAECAN